MGLCEDEFILEVDENLTEDEINEKVNDFYYDKIFEITGVGWEFLKSLELVGGISKDTRKRN